MPGATLLLRKRLYVTVGLPGSGKSTWLDLIGANAISSDEIRRWLTDDPTNQSVHQQVFETVRHVARQRLRIGRGETYVDATSLTLSDRAPYLELGRECDADVIALWFDVPADVCIARNAGRTRVVPEPAIREMVRKLVPPSREEGFAEVRVMWRSVR